MSQRIAQVIILAEDLRSARLFARYLQRTNRVDYRDIHWEHAEAGKGDASKWVVKQYPAEVQKQRRRVSGKNKNAALLVHVDADTGTVQARHQQLAGGLTESGQKPRGQDEQITIVVPRRHTETWLHGLCGVSLTEEYDCKRDPDRQIANPRKLKDAHDARIRPAAEALYAFTRPNAQPPPDYLPSVKAAIPELQRLES